MTRLALRAATIAVALIQSHSFASITSYASESAWLGAMGSTTLINFDDLVAPEVISSQYQGLTFSSSTPAFPKALVPQPGQITNFTDISAPNLLAVVDNFSSGGGDWRVDFDSPVSGVAFWAWDLQAARFPATTLEVTTEDSVMTAIDLVDLHPDATNGLDWRFAGVTSSGSGIVSMEVIVDAGDFVVFDNLQIPEPATLSLLALGGLMAIRRRR